MNRSPLVLTNDVRFCVSGTVTIHPTAAIAANVILRANPDSCLVIGAGVVVGEGCVIQAYGGSLVVEDGVTLGRQVLLIGQGIIHKNACIGTLSTVMANIAVMESAMIPAHSLMGAPEPQMNNHGVNNHGVNRDEEIPVVDKDAPDAQDPGFKDDSADQSLSQTIGSDSVETKPSALPHPNSHRMFMPINTPRYSGGAVDNVNAGRELGKPSSVQATSENPHVEEKDDSIENASGSSGSNQPSAPSVIYGKSSVQRLMTMMFPYRTLNDSGDDKE